MTNVLLPLASRVVRNCRCLRLKTPIVWLWGSLCLGSAMAQTAPRPTASSVTPVAVSIPSAAEELPPIEPTIVYQNGLLTITANNSTLGDVLRGISIQTGAEIDIPLQTEERVAVHMGPGLARDVVASLLAGSQFNYVLVGSESDSTGLTQVLLFLRPPPEHPVQALVAARAGQQERLGPADETTAEVTQQVADPSDPAALMRPQQQILQQRRQMVMEQFLQNTPSR